MTRKAYEKEKRRSKWGGGSFVGISRTFLASRLAASLTPYGIKLFFDLICQYNGMNNGDLSTAWSLMKDRGWSGRSILGKAQQELLDCGLLILTRQGGRHRANLYALSILSIDECKGKLEEVRATQHPPAQWLLTEQKLKSMETRHEAQKSKPCPSSRANCHQISPPRGQTH